MANIDLKDALYLKSIHENDRKYLRFEFPDPLYEFTCLPFGLNIAPFVFTKLLKSVISNLSERGYKSVFYLDDGLFIADSKGKTKLNV